MTDVQNSYCRCKRVLKSNSIIMFCSLLFVLGHIMLIVIRLVNKVTVRIFKIEISVDIYLASYDVLRMLAWGGVEEVLPAGVGGVRGLDHVV